jgi:hypothetical protein
MNTFYLTFLLACMATTLCVLYRNNYRKTHSSRSNIFNDCHGLLSDMVETRQDIGFPSLAGSYNGYRVKLDVQVDTLSMRKVPPLWLTITIKGREHIDGSLGILVRPQNTEFYSPVWEWDDTIANPPRWPQHAIVKHQGTLAPLTLLEDYVPELFGDEKVKELLITPALVKITYMAKQAERGEYLLMRNAVFDGLPIAQSTVAALLQSATAIRQKLEGAVQ